MCFTGGTRKLKKKYKKKNGVYPATKREYVLTGKFLKECLICQHCKGCFNLGSNEIKIHCSGCDKFYHCGIAGQCRGDKCNEITVEGTNHRQSWCIHCVPPIDGNEEKLNGEGSCLCYECLN